MQFHSFMLMIEIIEIVKLLYNYDRGANTSPVTSSLPNSLNGHVPIIEELLAFQTMDLEFDFTFTICVLRSVV